MKHPLCLASSTAMAVVWAFLCYGEGTALEAVPPVPQVSAAPKGQTQERWPEGMENHVIRFIRMKYEGTNWDAGMSDATRADLNFLEHCGKLTGFKVAKRGEAHAIRLLGKYPRGYEPPFVYMTGTGEIGVSSNEVQVMRKYLLGGGMLIGDSRSPGWTTNFMEFAKSVVPGVDLVAVPEDDPLFRTPYQFTNGAPRLLGYGGERVMGIKHLERWVVVFHPGGMGDAWKTGHSGLDPEVAEAAYRLGINLMHYAYVHFPKRDTPR